ncbi:MAG: NFACT RNA binding domain-containing protein [Eubacteriales bacterium]|nr:NFACT RNA binding domain-containing protein [Eubacteriales bacterium]
MAVDAIVVAATVNEFNNRILGASIVKVAQPDKDELLFTLKVNRKPAYLHMSANPSIPFCVLKDEGELSPVNAPSFCMALRKHIGGGRITAIDQAEGLERIIRFTIEHLDEMGDRGEKYLFVELMGRHSNIILTKPDMTIIDSIRHVSAATSSLREVLPGRTYFIPETKHTGFGRAVDAEAEYRGGIDKILELVRNREFEPCIIYENERPVEFSGIRLKSLEGGDFRAEYFDSMSEVIRSFYERKNIENRIRQKSEDLRLILKNLTERTAKKLDLQERQLKTSEDREKYRIYGELLNAFGYSLKGGEKSFTCENYYDNNNPITIPLDENKSAKDNAKKFFDRYQKLKRTSEAMQEQIAESKATLYTLESIMQSLYMCENDADLREIRNEMENAGFLKKSQGKGRIRKEEKMSEPLHFVSSDGIDIYVGRNNRQNEELDFKVADPDDWWFHAKKIPGSHVIVRTGKKELPDKTCLEAAALAAYYSKAGHEKASKVEVDYVKRRELKRVPGAAEGFVIYHTNYSIMIEPKSEI